MVRIVDRFRNLSERQRLTVGVVSLVVGTACIFLLSSPSPPRPLETGAALLGVALLVVGTLAVGTSEPRRNA